MSKQNILKDKSYLFAIRIVKFYRFLKEDKIAQSLIYDLEELIKLLVSIIKTTKASISK